MTDEISFYTSELSLQLGGGLLGGFFINWIFPEKVGKTTDKNVFKHTAEAGFQLILTSVTAVTFITWMNRRGWDPTTTAIGVAPFWIALLGAQPKMLMKISGVMEYFGGKIDSITLTENDSKK